MIRDGDTQWAPFYVGGRSFDGGWLDAVVAAVLPVVRQETEELEKRPKGMKGPAAHFPTVGAVAECD